MKALARKLSKLLNKDEISDIILFGSYVKGKISPNDIDIAVISKYKNQDIKKQISDIVPDAHIQFLSLNDIYNRIFITLIKEGFSVKYDKYLYEIYGISPIKLYKYDLRQLTPSNKVMFERGIKNIEGITKLSNRVVLVPIKKSSEFEDFLKRWNLDIETSEYELLPVIRREDFL